MGIEISVLGCDGGFAGPGGAGSGYLVRTDSLNIWLDAGPGSLAALQSHISLSEISAVIVTHEHPDHRADLEGLAVAAKFGERPFPIALYAPASVKECFYFSDWDVFDWQVVQDADQVQLADAKVSFSRTDHGPETLAVRIDAQGTSLGYSADTGPLWSLEALGPGLDLGLCEATWTAKDEGKAAHMSARQAGESGRLAGVGELMLTHRWPSVDPIAISQEGSEAFGKEVLQAIRGLKYEIKSAAPDAASSPKGPK